MKLIALQLDIINRMKASTQSIFSKEKMGRAHRTDEIDRMRSIEGIGLDEIDRMDQIVINQ